MVENEIQTLSRAAFRQMAPSILQLEMARLGGLICKTPVHADARNALVKARFELKQFIACLERTDGAPLEAACAPHLQAALLALSIEYTGLDGEAAATLRYVVDRVLYVHNLVGGIY